MMYYLLPRQTRNLFVKKYLSRMIFDQQIWSYVLQVILYLHI